MPWPSLSENVCLDFGGIFRGQASVGVDFTFRNFWLYPHQHATIAGDTRCDGQHHANVEKLNALECARLRGRRDAETQLRTNLNMRLLPADGQDLRCRQGLGIGRGFQHFHQTIEPFAITSMKKAVDGCGIGESGRLEIDAIAIKTAEVSKLMPFLQSSFNSTCKIFASIRTWRGG